jgi:glycine/serine hydroxymethyltransferase
MDFERFRVIADSVGAILLADISYFIRVYRQRFDE